VRRKGARSPSSCFGQCSTPRIRDALTLGVGAYLPGELLVRGPTPEFAPQTSRASRLSPTSPSRRCPPSSS
jgi:hypothetical protein